MTQSRSRLRALGLERTPLEGDPSGGQTDEQIAAYYSSANVGDRVAIRQTQHHVLRFVITEIADLNPKRGRLYVKQGVPWGGSAYYQKSGKSFSAPTGQTRLVVPTPEVVEWTQAHPDGVLTYDLRSKRIGVLERT